MTLIDDQFTDVRSADCRLTVLQQKRSGPLLSISTPHVPLKGRLISLCSEKLKPDIDGTSIYVTRSTLYTNWKKEDVGLPLLSSFIASKLLFNQNCSPVPSDERRSSAPLLCISNFSSKVKFVGLHHGFKP